LLFLLDLFKKYSYNIYEMEKEIVKTFKVKLNISPEDREKLDKTLFEYNNLLNYLSSIAWDKKITNKVKLHHLTYYPAREKFNLPAQFVCSARDVVCDRMRAIIKRKRKSKPQFKKPFLRYDVRTITFKEGYCSLSTSSGRIKTKIIPYDYLNQHKDWTLTNTPTLIKRNKDFYLCLHFKKTVVLKEPSILIGVDLGIKNISVTSDNKFFSGGYLTYKSNHFFRLRKALQAKGTPSAKRVLKRISGREKRFKLDYLHQKSKELVQYVSELQNPCIVFEKLQGIREQKSKGRKMNRKLSTWTFRKFQELVTYKANQIGVPVAFVDARYTSQKCSRCGNILKSQRTGNTFKCKACGFELNADLNGARNIRKNFTEGQAPQVGLSVNQPLSSAFVTTS